MLIISSLIRSFSMFLCLTFLGLGMVGCSNTKKDTDTVEPVEKMYRESMVDMDKGNFKEALKRLVDLERDHPFSIWATRAVTMEAYAYYQMEKYDDAIEVAERFIQMHPTHAEVPYAYYLRAISYYEQISDVRRDQHITEEARAALKDLINRFPNSSYAKDARIKLDLVNDHLAGKEMEIGRFYLHQGKLLPAINRFKNVIEHYQTTTHSQEALYRLTEAYISLGLYEEAQKNAAILGSNFPESKWYKRAYALLKEGKALPKSRSLLLEMLHRSFM